MVSAATSGTAAVAGTPWSQPSGGTASAESEALERLWPAAWWLFVVLGFTVDRRARALASMAFPRPPSGLIHLAPELCVT